MLSTKVPFNLFEPPTETTIKVEGEIFAVIAANYFIRLNNCVLQPGKNYLASSSLCYIPMIDFIDKEWELADEG